jgi:hypothetical protein
MALQYSKDLYGKTFATAYVRISQIRTRQEVVDEDAGLEESNGQTLEKVIVGDCIIQIFPDQAIREAGGDPMELMRENVTFDKTSTDNFYSQAYTYLKTLDEFAGAIDV